MATEQEHQPSEQEHPPSEQPPAPPRKATAKESLAFLTSGAKEKLDKTVVGMKGAGHIMTHGFSKQAKEEATAKTVEEKDAITDKQERIRQTAHLQLLQEKAAADGFEPLQAAPEGEGAQQLENGVAAPRDPENQAEPSPAGGGGNTLGEMLHSEDKTSEDSSDGSSRGRARALAQVQPDSQDYQSG